MSDRRGRLGSSSRPYAKEIAMGKENIYYLKQSNRFLAVNNSETIVLRQRFFSEEFECPCRPCNCNVVAKNNLPANEYKPFASKTPFQIHLDRAGNDLGKGGRFRERIAEYDARRVEEIKRGTSIFQKKIEKPDEFASQQRASLIKKQQPEVNLVRDRGHNLKESKAIVRNSVVPGNKPVIKSVKTISGVKLLMPQMPTARSWVDLSQVNKPSTSTNRASSSVKKNSIRPTAVQSNLSARRSSSTQSINKPNHLSDGWNRVEVRSRSCSSQRTPDSTRSTINPIRSTGVKSKRIQQKQQIDNEISKKLGGRKDSLISGSSNIFSRESSKRKLFESVKDHRNKENTRGNLLETNCEVISVISDTGNLSHDLNSNIETDEPSVDEISQKVQVKVESDQQNVKQNNFPSSLLYNTDYNADLLPIEMEKELQSPKLSSEFIFKYNNETRKIVVASLIQLSTHCRYPSFILYQAIKIFDVILDRLAIEETDLQLTAITALWIALKKDGNFNKIPSAQSMISYVPDLQKNINLTVLAQWERMALDALNFNITFSDPFSIFVFYLINYHYDPGVSNIIITKMYYCGKYTIDLTLLNTNFSYTSSIHLALATAELVMSVVLDDEDYLESPRWHYWRNIITDDIHMPIRIYDDQINLLRATMIHHIMESAKNHTKEEVVRQRYGGSRYGNISEFFISKIEKLSPTEYSLYL